MMPDQTGVLEDPGVVAGRDVAAAIQALSDPIDLHDARVALKRARALIRLCPSIDGGPSTKELRRDLRKAGKRLAARRDREAALEVIATVEDRVDLPEEMVASLEDGTVNGPRIRRLLDEVVARLESVREQVGRLDCGGDRRRVLKQMGRSYGKARRSWKKAMRQPTADALHRLRKRTKVLRYQMEWFAPAWPAVLEGWVRDLHTMTDELGQVHDVTVLRMSLTEPEDQDARARITPALRALHEDARRSRATSLARGGRLFAEKPGAFRKRMTRIAAAS